MRDRINSGLTRVRSALAGGQQQRRRQAKLPADEVQRLREENARLRARLLTVEGGTAGDGRVRAQDVVWILGSGRTGSSWLSFMMGEMPRHARWNEPLVGYLFAHAYYERGEHRLDERYFVLGDDYKDTWLGALRSLVLEGAAARFPEAVADPEGEEGGTAGGYVVIKEPHGSRGASFLSEALPESRMILLVRDPRDVVASTLHATWTARQGQTRPRRRRREQAIARPDEFFMTRARTYAADIGHAGRAYESHGGPKSLVRYEDLRADTLGTMKRIYSEIEIDADEGDLARAVDQFAWENIPETSKGRGKGRRKATPGGWREDLTPEQARIVEEQAAEVLEQYYADERGATG